MCFAERLEQTDGVSLVPLLIIRGLLSKQIWEEKKKHTGKILESSEPERLHLEEKEESEPAYSNVQS